MTDPRFSLTQQIRAARNTKGLTQEEVGAKMHCPQSYIARLESGQANMRLSSLIEMARLLDLELMLVPKQHVRMVESLIEGKWNEEATEEAPAYSADEK